MEFSRPEYWSWVAFPFSRGSSQPRDRTQVSHIAGGFFTIWVTREAQEYWAGNHHPPHPCSYCSLSRLLEELLHLFSPGHNSFNSSSFNLPAKGEFPSEAEIICWIWAPEKVELEFALAGGWTWVFFFFFPTKPPFLSCFTLQTLISQHHGLRRKYAVKTVLYYVPKFLQVLSQMVWLVEFPTRFSTCCNGYCLFLLDHCCTIQIQCWPHMPATYLIVIYTGHFK